MFFLVLVSLTGCAGYMVEHKKVYVDPSFRRIVIFNDTSNLILRDTGIFNESVYPGQRLEANVHCYDRFKGLIDAYRIIGRDEKGNVVLEWYGQRKYSMAVDGKNRSVRGISSDAYIVFSDRSFRPGKKREYWYGANKPCSIGPSMKIEVK